MSGVQRNLRAQIAYLEGQLKAYQDIVTECMGAALGLSDAEKEAFRPPPVEMSIDYNEAEAALRVQKWWGRLVERYGDYVCDGTELGGPRGDCGRPVVVRYCARCAGWTR